AVARSAGRFDYDPRRGAFRGRLFTVGRNKLPNFLGNQRRQGQSKGDTRGPQSLQQKPPPDHRAEKKRGRPEETPAVPRGAEQVRTSVQGATWQAFWQTAVEGKSGQEVAHMLGMSVAAVYLAKSRVMARLKEQIRQLQGE